MKYEKLNIDNGNKKFLYGLIMGVLLIIIVNLIFSYAKYKSVDSVKLAEGTINYTSADLNVIAMYESNGKTDVLIEEIPKGNYVIDNEKSYCETPSQKDIKNKITYDGSEVNIKITERGTKCYVYFISLAAKTLANLGITSDVIEEDLKTFTGTSCGSGCTDTNSGLYKGTDADGTTYYYRGNVNNNWVKFANMYWRIIRINGDGSIRLIYSGEGTPATTGKSTAINSGNSQAFNTNIFDNKYVGFMYSPTGETASSSYPTTAETANSTNSSILDTIKSWYETKLKTSYGNKLDGNAGFCGDRSKATDSHGESYTNQGFGTYATVYGPADRVWKKDNTDFATSITPTFSCRNQDRDLYTTEGSSKGNKKLPVPVGLITMDEVIFAGGYPGQTNQGESAYYLYTNEYYWTMSPTYFNGNFAYVFYVYASGYLGNLIVGAAGAGVRPVINLKASTTFSPEGKGTTDNPYVVE